MAETEAMRVANLIVRDVCELPDYTSPDDQPDLLQCTVEELQIICAQVIADAMAKRDARIAEALAPVMHWYQSDEHPNRPVHEILADVVSDLQTDRAASLRYHAAEAGLKADAARYRWLRDESCPPHNFYVSVPDEFKDIKYGAHQVDAYIDEARLIADRDGTGAQ